MPGVTSRCIRSLVGRSRISAARYLKLLHPHEQWTHGELREYLELALEGRLRVKQQLGVLAPHEYAKTDFSYIENDTSREIFVRTAERPTDVSLSDDRAFEREAEA